MSKVGYSGTPLSKKLGIKSESRVWIDAGPESLLELLDLPDPSIVLETLESPVDVAVLFCENRNRLKERFGLVAETMRINGGLWIAWPKKQSGVSTDLTENFVRDHGLALGWVDNKVCAIDATWSGLRFVRRLKDR